MFKTINYNFLVLIMASGLGSKAYSQNRPYKSLYNLSFERLDQFDTFDANTLNGKPSLWIVFQPKCSSCESQFNDLSCLPEDVATFAIGINGTRDKLARVLQFSTFKGYKVLAKDKFKKDQGVAGTPTLLFVDKNGKLGKKITGLVACTKILKLLNLNDKSSMDKI